jgi:hypothetical protein
MHVAGSECSCSYWSSGPIALLSVRRHLSIVYTRLTGSVHKAIPHQKKKKNKKNKVILLAACIILKCSASKTDQFASYRITLEGDGSWAAESGRSERNVICDINLVSNGGGGYRPWVLVTSTRPQRKQILGRINIGCPPPNLPLCICVLFGLPLSNSFTQLNYRT